MTSTPIFNFLLFILVALVTGCSGGLQQNDNEKEPEQNNHAESVSETENASYKNALEFLKSQEQFTIFTESIYKYGFDTILLKEDVSYTVIALTDKATENIPMEIGVKLDADTAGSRIYLSRHVLPHPFIIAEDSVTEAMALSGDRFTFRKGKEGYLVNDILLSNSNIQAGKDIVHTTDNLLFMPE